MPAMPRPTGPVGLYDPRYEHDACGVAFVARLSGDPTHETVQRAIVALENLEHRGAAGADPNTGDGAGILLQMPDELMRGVDRRRAAAARAHTASASASCPRTRLAAPSSRRCSRSAVTDEGQKVVGWRDIPVDKDYVGITANFYAPYIKQLSSPPKASCAQDHDAFERKLYVIRRVAELAAGPDLVIPSFSARTVVYKGMLTAPQLLGYYPDLQDPRTKSALALVHSPLLHQHLPELGARAPVPDDRPQRRDQHAARQRQLDARARVAARLRAVRRRPARRSCRSSAPAARTRRRSTTCSSCSRSPAAASRTR